MNFETAREQMLGQQIRAWNVLDESVLAVLKTTPRELFVPESERDLAFADAEIPLPHGQHMMSPKIEARILQELQIEPTDDVLEIGTGSGYLTACLAQLGGHVESIEIFADLSEVAAERIRRRELQNVEYLVGDALSLSRPASFDVIAVTGSAPVLPEQFVQMLRPNGRLFIVVGRDPVMEAKLISMDASGNSTEQSLFETLLTPLINAIRAEPFVL